MSIVSVPAAWKTAYQEGPVNTHHERVKIDFRGRDYPDVSRDTRSYIDRGDCESATGPAARGETSNDLSNATFARSTDYAYGGSYSFKHTKTIAAGTASVARFQDGIVTTDMHGYLPGETVEAVAWVYVPASGGPTAAEVSLYITNYVSAAWTDIDSASPTTTDAWEKITVRGQISDDATGFACQMHIESTAADTEYYYIDDVEVYRYPTFTLAREDNLMDRANCESTTVPAINGLTAAAATNGSFARDSTVSRSGDYSFKHTITATGTAGVAFLTPNSTTNMCGFASGEVVEYECYVYAPDAAISLSEISLRMEEYDASGAAWTSLGASTASGATLSWIKISGTWTIPSDDVTGIRIYLAIAASASNGEFYYVDDFIVRRHSVPGTHYLSGGYTEHLVALPDTFTFQIKFKPGFAFNTASNQELFGWYADADSFFRVVYVAAADIWQVIWYDGGTARSMSTAQYDNGTTHRNINQWITMTVAIDTTTGDTTGSAVWMNKTQDDISWNGAIDAKSSELNIVEMRARQGTIGDQDIAYAMMIPDYVATDANVQADFEDVEEEQIYWSFDGHATGMTRCDVTRHVRSISTEVGLANRLSGSFSANTASVELINTNGEFSDDQYAAFAPASDQFNGTVTQKYLQQKSRVWIKSWHLGDFDHVLVGRVTDAGYGRKTQRDNASSVNIEVEDGIAEMALTPVNNAEVHEDTKLSDDIEADSLVHITARKARTRIKQYLSNNWFSDATITDAWTASGGTFTRQADATLFGAYAGRIVPGAGTENFYAIVTFDNDEKLSVGQAFTASIFVKSAAAASGVNNYIALNEYDSGGSNDSTTTSYVLAGGEDWKLYSVTHTITDSDSDELRFFVYAAAGDTVDCKAAMLVQGTTQIYAAQESSLVMMDAAASGAIDASYAEVIRWDWFGFDVDDAEDGSGDIVHPWYRMESRSSVWNNTKLICSAMAPRYTGMDRSGTYRLRSILASDYSEPISQGTLDETLVMQGISTNLTVRQANKIIGHGATYKKYAIERIVWDAKASDAFVRDTSGQLKEAIGNGETWPDPNTFGSFYGHYGDPSVEIEDSIEMQEYEPPTSMELLAGGIEGVFNATLKPFLDWLTGLAGG